jgi:UDP-N-acetyl-D-galactosamine dehydrogenase
LRISVIGLGYVGLPLAVGLSRRFDTVGFDISAERIEELKSGIDRTGEVEQDELRASPMTLTARPSEMKGSDLFIVTVPTPVDDANRPDLSLVLSACETVGKVIAKGATVVFESTVYPGVTEDVCGPALAKVSGVHTLSKITKVIAGQTPEVVEKLAAAYGAVTEAGVFVARNIRTAEAAKVIENAQRDINIAFINEITQIFQKLGISAYDVLEAAKTKWNFLDFRPGLVGGHCIGVDPFYLAHCAQKVGHNPEIILAGRRINDGMGTYVAERVAKLLTNPEPGRKDILVLGLTFKENVPDLRNSKVVDVVTGLRMYGHRITVHDPFADPREARAHYHIELAPHLPAERRFDCLVGAVAHREYCAFDAQAITGLLKPGGLVADVKGMWRKIALPDTIQRWEL